MIDQTGEFEMGEKLHPGDTNQQNIAMSKAAVSSTQVFSNISLDTQVPQAATQAEAHSYVEVVKGPYAGEYFCLDYNLVTIGRDPECSIFLNDMTVSREHCKLEKREGFWHLTDCGSLNGTWVNGAIVSEADLYDGSSIQIGTYVLVLHISSSDCPCSK